MMMTSLVLPALIVLMASSYLGGVTVAFTAHMMSKACFSSSTSTTRPAKLLELRSMSTSTAEETGTTLKSPYPQTDRYIATNRFAVRAGKEAKFEARWATRKSRLSTLEGFNYFHLMRRVSLDGSTFDEAFGNYVSFTVWSEKKHFTAWRKGDAFKEAHGGTSIGDFVSTLVSSILVLQGAPKPAFYDGILIQSTIPDLVPETQDGWRVVEANGKDLLPVECFVACNQFYIPEESRGAFESRWANRESKLKECDGFVAFGMLRRDGSMKGHGTVEMDDSEPTYLSTTIWEDRAAFDAWRTGQSFKDAHGGGKPTSESSQPPKPLWSKPPSPIFYEGTLVITRPDGV
jgi:heme-degrading monooxygenase HmoA